MTLTLRGTEGPEPYEALSALLIEVGAAAIVRGDVVALIHIDEVQNITDDKALSQLLIALGDALTYETEVTVAGGTRVRRALPLVVYLTRIAEAMGLSKTTDAGPTSQQLDTVRGIIDRGRPYTLRHRAVEAYRTSDSPNA